MFTGKLPRLDVVFGGRRAVGSVGVNYATSTADDVWIGALCDGVFDFFIIVRVEENVDCFTEGVVHGADGILLRIYDAGLAADGLFGFEELDVANVELGRGFLFFAKKNGKEIGAGNLLRIERFVAGVSDRQGAVFIVVVVDSEREVGDEVLRLNGFGAFHGSLNACESEGGEDHDDGDDDEQLDESEALGATNVLVFHMIGSVGRVKRI